MGVEPSDEEHYEYTEPDEPEHAEPRPVDKWRRNTATGALTAALALGMQQVFDPEKKDTIGIEQAAPTQPVDPDEKIELRFDPLNSHGNTVVVHAPKPGASEPDGSTSHGPAGPAPDTPVAPVDSVRASPAPGDDSHAGP